jgi:hypothetical protein
MDAGCAKPNCAFTKFLVDDFEEWDCQAFSCGRDTAMMVTGHLVRTDYTARRKVTACGFILAVPSTWESWSGE